MAVGRIEPFDLDKGNWETYVDRLEQYFVANVVKPELQVPTLITVIGNDAYNVMVKLCTPTKPANKSYLQLVTIMKRHFNPKPNMLAERFKFRQRIQKSEESIMNFVTELKKNSKQCGFSEESLRENLRDQFVCGLINDDIRQRLLTEDITITFERAYKIAMSIEATEAFPEGCTKSRPGDNRQEMVRPATAELQHIGHTAGARGGIRGGRMFAERSRRRIAHQYKYGTSGTSGAEKPYGRDTQGQSGGEVPITSNLALSSGVSTKSDTDNPIGTPVSSLKSM
ncbi:uncharacterized protein LOC131846057 [Achroia grisella]|uniref:uncharacterized protein LOC131846057 n=1 Tax=Achroia grisella TaxID=688607 RepID=UPI0027D349E3|nr:uncharacterized protein LOC131846057 [Achroia grisella]